MQQQNRGAGICQTPPPISLSNLGPSLSLSQLGPSLSLSLLSAYTYINIISLCFINPIHERIRGFKLRHRVTRLFSFVLRRNGYMRIGSPTWESKPEAVSRLFTRVKTKLAKSICSLNPGRILVPGLGKGYVPLPDREKEKPAVPKGRTAVYVGGRKDDGGDFQRVLVPVIYFNHPLFAALLREAEEEFGFNHPGGITIPCQISEFESVRTRIAAGNRCRKLLTWKKTLLTY